MIVQALYQRYQDLAADPDSGISELYFSRGKVSYVLELERDGSLSDVKSVKVQNGKKWVPLQLQVPEQPSRSNGINPYFLTDKAEYVIGYYAGGEGEALTAKKAADASRKFEAFRALTREVLADSLSEATLAVLAFLDRWQPENVRNEPLLQTYMEDLDKGIDTGLAFRLRGAEEDVLIHSIEAVKTAWIRYRQSRDAVSEYDAQCLVTGMPGSAIAKTHDKIKGVRNAQQAGASLVSFNFRAVESYGKEDQQSYNSPVSKIAAFGYSTALNHLLSSPRNRMFVGDMTIVFWSGRSAAAMDIEEFFSGMVNPYRDEANEDTSITASLKEAVKRLRQGKELRAESVPQGDTPFYVLGLSPNNARVAIRFFWQGNLDQMVCRLGQHAADYALTAPEGQQDGTPSIYRILEETRRVGSDGKKVGDEPPSRLGGELLRAVIQGSAYPYSLYTSIINRVRADGIVGPLRAAMLKAQLTRYVRTHDSQFDKEALSMSLNTETTEPAYRLGRLFAVLERAQQEAAGGAGRLNATIKDRYFNSASSNPAAVFPILIKLSQHHMSKAKYGDFRDRDMQEILDGVDKFPQHLSLEGQGLFILGYYHQKQAFSAQIKAASEAKQEAAAAATTEE
ncbi:type I-C CRISPR-associated protein Cas8c/Csd1 [Cohnella sp. GCM10020058]|uniref:type I-C CRISPR-associated protein Cas8c/Csd1 n=1 Tax=Cohnella sp. GCM10020058 TaxID=3317330 RepID=UPI0036318273